jgi:uncharacterized membrane protein
MIMRASVILKAVGLIMFVLHHHPQDADFLVCGILLGTLTFTSSRTGKVWKL